MNEKKISVIYSLFIIIAFTLLIVTLGLSEMTIRKQNEQISDMIIQLSNKIQEPSEKIVEVPVEVEKIVEVPVEKVVETIKELPVEVPVYREIDDDIFCLAAAIYQEAGSDYNTDDLRMKVGDVILNRVMDDRFPNTIREVLVQTNPPQYDNFCSGYVSIPWKAFTSEIEMNAYYRAYNIAVKLLNGEHSNLYGEGYIWQCSIEQGHDGFWQEGVWFAK